MLYYVSGVVTVLEPGLAVIDCNGVGYGCRVTAYTAAQLKLDKPAKLYITESIREDAFDLYGFSSREEQRCYSLLTSVNGVGPKAAMAILASGPQNFTLAVMTGDEKLLTAAQGVGKKIAQRIILELKDKIGGSSMELDFSGPAVSAPAAPALSRLRSVHIPAYQFHVPLLFRWYAHRCGFQCVQSDDLCRGLRMHRPDPGRPDPRPRDR